MHSLHVVLVEDGLHRPNRFQRLANFFEQRFLQHLGVYRGLVGVVVENVPTAEDQVFDFGERNEILNLGRAAFRTLTQTDGAELGERSDGWPSPRFTASTPAMKVVLTAPMPGIRIPNFPSAGAILVFPVVDNESPWVARRCFKPGPRKGTYERLSYAILTFYDEPRDRRDLRGCS